jgi:hypothetical protein
MYVHMEYFESISIMQITVVDSNRPAWTQRTVLDRTREGVGDGTGGRGAAY